MAQIIQERIDPHTIGIKVYFDHGYSEIIPCDSIEINRIVDEILIFQNNFLKGRFNISKIAGYIVCKKGGWGDDTNSAGC